MRLTIALFFSEPTTETTTGNTTSPGKKQLFLTTKGTQREFSKVTDTLYSVYRRLVISVGRALVC